MSVQSKMAATYIRQFPVAAALQLQKSPQKDLFIFLQKLDQVSRQLLLPHLSRHLVAGFLKESKELAGEVLSVLTDGEGAAILMAMQEDEQRFFLGQLPIKKSKRIEQMLSFSLGSAASFMNTLNNPLLESTFVKTAMDQLQSEADPNFYQYIVNDEDVLSGYVDLHRLYRVERESEGDPINQPTLKDIMLPIEYSIHADHRISEVARNRGWEKFQSLPVVDYEDRYLGVLTYGRLRSVLNSNDRFKNMTEIRQTGSELNELFSLGLAAFVSRAQID